MEPIPKTIRIYRDRTTDCLTVDPDPLTCHVEPEDPKKPEIFDQYVEWTSTEEDYKDWRVVFGPQAPLSQEEEPKEKVATPDRPTMELRHKRPEDLRHVKYTVVALDRRTGMLDHKDPELIIET